MMTTRLVVLLFIFIKADLLYCATESSTNADVKDVSNSTQVVANKTKAQEALPTKFPFSVYIQLTEDPEGIFCGGTLISRQYVLTAASCVYDYYKVYVLFGANRSSPILRIKSPKSVVHPNFNKRDRIHDIAIVDLGVRVVLTPEIATIELPNMGQLGETFEYYKTYITSWAQKTGGKLKALSEIKYVNVTIASINECSKLYGKPARGSTICAKNIIAPDNNVCNGVLGDPLIYYENGTALQIGIANVFSKNNCSVNDPIGFLLPHYYLYWITDETDLPGVP